MKFSVVIPCFNNESTIARAVLAALDQTHPPNEIVVVDDFSSDRSVEIVERIASDSSIKIIVIRLQVNSGAGIARNAGAEVCSSENIAFCDADDFWSQEHLACAADIINEDSLESDLIGGSVKFLSGKQNATVSMAPIRLDNSNINQLLIKNIMVTSTLIVKKNVFEKTSFSDLSNRQDLEFICKTLKSGKIAIWHPIRSVFYDDQTKGISSNKIKMIKYNFIVCYRITRSILVSLYLVMRWALFNQIGLFDPWRK